MTVRYAVDSALYLYQLTLIVYILLSWFQGAEWAMRVRVALDPVVEPYLGVFRRIVPVTGMIDFSPLVALLVLQLLIRPALLVLLGSLGL